MKPTPTAHSLRIQLSLLDSGHSSPFLWVPRYLSYVVGNAEWCCNCDEGGAATDTGTCFYVYSIAYVSQIVCKVVVVDSRIVWGNEMEVNIRKKI